MYGKIFASTFTGSMRGAGSAAFAVWSYILANTGKDHRVEINVEDVASRIGMPVTEVEQVISGFCGPDVKSRSLLNDGAKLVREGAYLYFVVNHESYREILHEDDRKEYFRIKQQECRDRKKQALLSEMTPEQRRAYEDGRIDEYGKRRKRLGVRVARLEGQKAGAREAIREGLSEAGVVVLAEESEREPSPAGGNGGEAV